MGQNNLKKMFPIVLIAVLMAGITADPKPNPKPDPKPEPKPNPKDIHIHLHGLGAPGGPWGEVMSWEMVKVVHPWRGRVMGLATDSSEGAGIMEDMEDIQDMEEDIIITENPVLLPTVHAQAQPNPKDHLQPSHLHLQVHGGVEESGNTQTLVHNIAFLL